MLLRHALKGFVVKLAEGKPLQVQVLRTGKFNHPVYGEFEITAQTLAEMKKNFDEKVRGIDIAVDYFHDSDKEAAGWFNALELKENGEELWASVEWTPAAIEKIKNKELKYFSPDFAFQWSDPETGVTHENVLFGGGLTNRPFVKEMAAIAATETEKGNQMTLKELQDKVAKLEADNKKLSEEAVVAEKKMGDMQGNADKVAALEAQIAELQKQLEAEKANVAKMGEEKKAAEAATALAEKKTQFAKLLSEGKACAAQEEAYIKGDMNEFVKLAQPVNLGGKGATTTGDGDSREDKVIKLADEKQKADPKLSRVDAVSLANKEIK